jgi:hypothetical protein
VSITFLQSLRLNILWFILVARELTYPFHTVASKNTVLCCTGVDTASHIMSWLSISHSSSRFLPVITHYGVLVERYLHLKDFD